LHVGPWETAIGIFLASCEPPILMLPTTSPDRHALKMISSPPDLRLGIDIGGTFTDFALVNGEGGAWLSTSSLPPHDPAEAVLTGTRATLRKAGRAVTEVTEIVHGTTLVTNALIERRGARTGMLVTGGFRDLLDIGREGRYDLFDLRIHFAEPLGHDLGVRRCRSG
jgi:N-methylhydantoinase A/oxoprolinase/acetone carboxylase beta subunit